ncbi:isoprenoid synthase domain-containing protein [Favolaschia claudopus]|uniref:Isoprenoid synthase domain-containing protein n=1 Tax=Favolaschia claudopus TaxID=2862362 RepID=A0AAW0CBE8_9AGAR
MVQLASRIPHKDYTEAAIVRFLRGISQPFPAAPSLDKQFYLECHAGAVERGWPADSVAKHLPGGVAMGSFGYAHLPNRTTRILIAIYTACGIYLDDVYKEDVDAASMFNQRFFEHSPQADPVLDCFARVILELGDHFERVASNIMMTSTLNAVTALTLEFKTQGMPIHPKALGYPTFSRVMSGASEAYTIFIFPSDLPLRAFVQILQQCMIFINNGNDVLSFYKEEIDEECVNRISFLATQTGKSKQLVLENLAEEAIVAHRNVTNVLEQHPRALAAFRSFVAGYIGFHAAAKRYRLNELDL